jgi:ABC-2 type transport system permease protein
VSALVRRGLLDRRRAPLTWGGSLGALCALVVAVWPSIEGSVGDLLENYPAGLKEAFGIEELNTVEAYLDAEMFSLVLPLAVALFAIRVVVAGVAGAEERGWLDTLLSAPVARRTLVAATAAVAAVATAAVLAVMTAVTWLAGVVVGTGLSLGLLVAGAASVWALAMFFAGLAALAAGAVHHPAAATAVAVGTLVAMYALDLVGKLSPDVEELRYASVFRVYGNAVRDGLDPLAFAGLTLAGAALAAAGAWLFERRDVL